MTARSETGGLSLRVILVAVTVVAVFLAVRGRGDGEGRRVGSASRNPASEAPGPAAMTDASPPSSLSTTSSSTTVTHAHGHDEVLHDDDGESYPDTPPPPGKQGLAAMGDTRQSDLGPELARAAADVRLVVQEVVTGGPDGDVRYVVAIDHGRTDVHPGDHPAPDVTFVVDWDTAVAVATGSTSTQDAFTTGRLQVRGDMGVLLRHGTALAGLDAVFAEVRAATTY